MNVRLRGWDLAALVGAFVVGAALTWVLFAARGPYPGFTWFSLDEYQYYAIATDPDSKEHVHTNQHPLISLLVFLPVQAVARLSGSLDVGFATWAVVLGGLWVASTFAAGRLLGLGRGWSLVASGLVASSGAFFLYAGVVEPWGGLTGSAVAVSLGLAGWAWRRGPGRGGLVHAAAVAVPLAVTTPLAVHGVVGAVVGRLGWRRVVQVAVNGFAAVALLSGVQMRLFPEATQFVLLRGSRFREFVNVRPSGYWLSAPMETVAATFAMPRSTVTVPRTEGFVPTLVPLPSGVLVLVVVAIALAAVAWVAWRSGDGRSGRDRGRLLVLSVGSMLAMTALHGYEPVLHVAAVASPSALLVVHAVREGARARMPWGVAGLVAVVVAQAAWNASMFEQVAAVWRSLSGA